MTRTNIPKTDSIQALAHFWDTHDLTDFEDELEEVSEPVFKRQTSVTVCLAPDEFKVVEALAMSRGISRMNLIQEWVSERIRASSG